METKAVRLDADLYAKLKKRQNQVWEKSGREPSFSELLAAGWAALETPADGISADDLSLLREMNDIRSRVGDTAFRAGLNAVANLAAAAAGAAGQSPETKSDTKSDSSRTIKKPKP